MVSWFQVEVSTQKNKRILGVQDFFLFYFLCIEYLVLYVSRWDINLVILVKKKKKGQVNLVPNNLYLLDLILHS